MWTYGNRLFAIRGDVPETLSYTQETTEPDYPRWHSALTKRIDNDGGPPTAGGQLGNTCVVFQENQIVGFSGAGPDGTGQNDQFSRPEIIANGVGVSANEAVSVVKIPQGLLFRHSTGIHLLGVDGSVNFVGRAVQDLVSSSSTPGGLFGQTTAAAYLPSRHQVWIAGENQSILVFDTRFMRWSKFRISNHVVRGIVELNGIVYVLTTNSSTAYLYKYDTTKWTTETCTVTTPLFRGAGTHGHMRVWSAAVSVNRIGYATQVLLVYTYTVQPHRQTKDSAVADGRRTFEDGSVEVDGPTDLRLRPQQQRCSAIKLRIQIPGGDEGTEGFRLVGIKYLFGVITQDGQGSTKAIGS